MAEALGNIGDVRSTPFQNRSVGMAGRVGAYPVDAEGFADHLHPLVDSFGKIFCPLLLCQCILFIVKAWENIIAQVFFHCPTINDRLHFQCDDSVDFFDRAGRAFGFLPDETNFAIDDIFIFQPNQIGGIDPVTQIHEKPNITVTLGRFRTVGKCDDLPDLFQRNGLSYGFSGLYLVAVTTERILRIFDRSRLSGPRL